MPSESMPRRTEILRRNWRFCRQDPLDAADPDFDDSAWSGVTVPHDWAVAGPFDPEHDTQELAIWEDGEKKPSTHVGRTGALPHVGVAWYRRQLEIPADAAGKHFRLEFDGVMSHSKVYVNGIAVGSWPFGYASFAFDVTAAITAGAANTIAVRVDNKPGASRWYPGAGIFRHVRLVTLNPVHIDHWGINITTPDIRDAAATVRVRTTVVGSGAELTTRILDPTGVEVAGQSSPPAPGHSFDQTLTVPDPIRWELDTCKLYTAVSELRLDGELVDVCETPFGLREIEFTRNNGFRLNGKRVQLNGVCLHHDLGALGSAVNRRALERQLEILQGMGCNAIRTSHNPPAPELLELCDTMGILVIDEAFDEWRAAKVPNGYHILFDDWAEKDLRALIKRDRNHPCVIMWSIGNEIGEQSLEDGAAVAGFLTEICHDEDPTRPVTAGFNSSDNAIKNGLADAVDIPGWNYKPFKYQEYRDAHPDWIMYGSETESCVSSRGFYYFPVAEERHNSGVHEHLHMNAYDLSAPGWGYAPDHEFAAQEDCPFMLGEFVWTGFDYLGEPTPYKHEWPSRSSYFGIVDLCGLPKDRYYLYRSQWRRDVDTLHLLPHWNWHGREGEITPVHCFTGFDTVELFINGESQGVRRKDPKEVLGRFRLIWDDVKYAPGVIKAVALDADGKVLAEAERRTAGAPAGIRLQPDRDVIHGDGLDLSFITVSIVDAAGTICPLADNLVHFTVAGAGEIAAVDNGDQTSLADFQAAARRAFSGQCMLIVRSLDGVDGKIAIKAESDGLDSAGIAITATTTA